MGDYFKNLNGLDPLFHAIVVTRLKEKQKETGVDEISIDDLTGEDELIVLRKYCLTMYKEYKTLRTVFLENMGATANSAGLKYHSN